MSDLIERDKAMDVLDDFQSNVENCVGNAYAIARRRMTAIPSARPKGEWMEREVLEDTVINEWQSARCSECAKYHTTPYMYYFDNFNFCPNCGADMRKGVSND